jgi:hypothetical protein
MRAASELSEKQPVRRFAVEFSCLAERRLLAPLARLSSEMTDNSRELFPALRIVPGISPSVARMVIADCATGSSGGDRGKLHPANYASSDISDQVRPAQTKARHQRE